MSQCCTDLLNFRLQYCELRVPHPRGWHSFFNSPAMTTVELSYWFDLEKPKSNSDQLYLSALKMSKK